VVLKIASEDGLMVNNFSPVYHGEVSKKTHTGILNRLVEARIKLH